MSETTVGQMRASALDGLRGISAQVVFVAHLLKAFWPGLPPVMVNALEAMAYLAVVAFFMLSGYVIAGSIAARSRSGRFDLVGFGVARVARIYPPYIAAIILCFALGWLMRLGLIPIPEIMRGWPIDLGIMAMLRALVFLYLQHDLMTRLDGPLWSLRLEVILYVVAACLAVIWTWRGVWRVLAAAFALVLLAGMLRGLSGALLAIITFGIGALSFFVAPWLRARFNPAWSAAAAAIGIGLSLAILGSSQTFGLGQRWELAVTTPLALVSGVVIAQLAGGEGTLATRLSRAAPLGAFSYTLYIIHLPLIYVVQSVEPGGSVAAIAMAAATFVGIQALAFALARPLENHTAFVAMLQRILPKAMFRA
jgi:peptidoglycan/LPS O-acetylase OafA/YrhL